MKITGVRVSHELVERKGDGDSLAPAVRRFEQENPDARAVVVGMVVPEEHEHRFYAEMRRLAGALQRELG